MSKQKYNKINDLLIPLIVEYPILVNFVFSWDNGEFIRMLLKKEHIYNRKNLIRIFLNIHLFNVDGVTTSFLILVFCLHEIQKSINNFKRVSFNI
jgi:hypothetical protein